MSLIRTSVIVNKISGTTANTTFVNSRYGQQLRQRTYHPDKNPSLIKYNSTIRFNKANESWADVSQAQFKAWDDLAKTFTRINKVGEEVPVRQVDLFKHINNNLLEIGESVILECPEKIFPEEFKNADIKISASDMLKDIRVFFSPAIDKNTKIIIDATHSLKPGVHVPKNYWFRKIALIDSTFTSGFPIIKQYLAVFQNKINYPFKTAFRFKPVSKISGLTSAKLEIIVSAF